jgi:hypothetical protein
MISTAFALFFDARFAEISTSVLVVPDTAERITIFLSPQVISLATACILSGLPTDVPPNFRTFIYDLRFVLFKK